MFGSKSADFVVDEDFVLVTPTYGAAHKGFVPKQVVKFLNNPANRARIKGVIGAGNRTFGSEYAIAADMVSAKLEIPVLYRFELAGTEEDVRIVKEGLTQFWDQTK